MQLSFEIGRTAAITVTRAIAMKCVWARGDAPDGAKAKACVRATGPTAPHLREPILSQEPGVVSEHHVAPHLGGAPPTTTCAQHPTPLAHGAGISSHARAHTHTRAQRAVIV